MCTQEAAVKTLSAGVDQGSYPTMSFEGGFPGNLHWWNRYSYTSINLQVCFYLHPKIDSPN